MTKDRKMKISSYAAWKKRERPESYMTRDFTKSWIKETIGPTLTRAGFGLCCQKYDYQLFAHEKPGDMAVRLILESHSGDWVSGREFVYSATRGRNGYEDALLVYSRPANGNAENQ